MFVRWKKRTTGQGYSLSAHLVKAVRIDGKPRHQVITHLCTLQSTTMQQLAPWLWQQVEARLQGVEIDAQTRERVCQAIAQNTPRATPEQMTAAAQPHEQNIAQLPALFPSLKNSLPPVPPPAIGPEISPRGAYQVQW